MSLEKYITKYKGTITFNSLTHLDFGLATVEVIDWLKEDLLQVEFDNNQLLDIGWYPEFNIDGHFTVQLIADYNWETPLFKENCCTFKSLEDTVIKALNYLK
ncbi:MAG: hypothetical protein LBI72_12985 [Flavobacteriaceae bacterium]|jgi:hypothetical protein|nr:hypothetical protein [Flavobacteriaceae bacterium]